MRDSKSINLEIVKIVRSKIFFIFVFLSGLLLRLLAAIRIPINSREASILLSITNDPNAKQLVTSIIETLLIRLSFFLFGKNNLAARIWPVLASSILLLLPLFLSKKNNRKSFLVFSLLMAIDPFVIANSIQIGSNIFAILFLSLFIVNSYNRKWNYSYLALFALLLSGRGLLPALCITIGFFLLDRYKNWKVFSGLLLFIKTEKMKKIVSIVTIILVCMLISGIEFDSILIDLQPFVDRNEMTYKIPVVWSGFPVVLFSYSPLMLLLFILLVVSTKKIDRTIIIISAISIVLLIFLVLISRRSYSDLVWITWVMSIGSAWLIRNFPMPELFKGHSILIILIMTIGLISLLLSFSSFVSRGHSGGSQYNAIINIFTLSFLLCAAFIFFLYIRNGREFIRAAIISLLIISSFLQISFSVRASGLAGNPNQELLVDGALMDRSAFKEIDKTINLKEPIKTTNLTFAVEDTISSQIVWELREVEIEFIPKQSSGLIQSDAIITDSSEIDLEGSYIGQPFIVNSFPEWINNPIFNIVDYDYWSWLLFRETAKSKTENIIWITPK